MKILVISYMIIYLLVTLIAAIFSYFKTKKMTILRLLLTVLSLALLAISTSFYAQSYQDWQMLGFALGFTFISTLFLYNGTKEGSNFTIIMLFSVGRFILHIQFLILLYLFR
ncbi:hypothetical protein [Streptococcus ruminantium]|uniref:Uncharacterized protein n=2 Tax=Streptococcus ruminantium TaxID=1917441 RepID=A0ABU1B3F4_9STRE|nr:hypothetical protein [Streptococcus ruminantium]MDQ8758449.1 hypothetical protein [Streptococcus ruminantium]MDQ8764863.1 hypothetical protein [Streptococcus ruminantium]MDQ8767659.1 hypothetical protein [Streptococcus ruminantium]MDQ8768190.1 hypothetical protein [Streptococcus ruminantium]MDQ8773913.1 hypothetical protein [Streptococcus ruminantium]